MTEPVAIYGTALLAETRAAKRLRDLARSLDIDPSVPQTWASGKRPIPAHRVAGVAAWLGLTVEEMLARRDPREVVRQPSRQTQYGPKPRVAQAEAYDGPPLFVTGILTPWRKRGRLLRLAARLDLSMRTVRRWAAGERTVSRQQVGRLAAALGLTVAELVAQRDPRRTLLEVLREQEAQERARRAKERHERKKRGRKPAEIVVPILPDPPRLAYTLACWLCAREMEATVVSGGEVRCIRCRNRMYAESSTGASLMGGRSMDEPAPNRLMGRVA